MGDNKDVSLVHQITTMRERTEHLCKSVFQTANAPIMVRLQMIHTLFCAIEAQLQDRTILDNSGTSRLSKEEIEEIATAVARKIDRAMYVVEESPPSPKRRPS